MRSTGQIFENPLCPATPVMGKDQFAKGGPRGILPFTVNSCGSTPASVLNSPQIAYSWIRPVGALAAAPLRSTEIQHLTPET